MIAHPLKSCGIGELPWIYIQIGFLMNACKDMRKFHPKAVLDFVIFPLTSNKLQGIAYRALVLIRNHKFILSKELPNHSLEMMKGETYEKFRKDEDNDTMK